MQPTSQDSGKGKTTSFDFDLDREMVSRQYIDDDDVVPVRKDDKKTQEDDWASVTDPTERRRRQNKLAQRRFREKKREEREETERSAENQKKASGSYAAVEPQDLDLGRDLSGLPWGGLSMKHIVESGRTRDQNSYQSSRENSVFAPASRTGGSSRLGLRLTDQFSRGTPGLRFFPYLQPNWRQRR